MIENIEPIPAAYGVGFTSKTYLGDAVAAGYEYKKAGIYHNYHFTPANCEWPNGLYVQQKVIDGFSPNLNKFLHAGHLKNLAVAASISNILGTQPVAMLGASLGIKEGSQGQLNKWYALAGYDPKQYLDINLGAPAVDLHDGGPNTLLAGSQEPKDTTGCKLWYGPKGAVILYKSDGKPTYAAHDLSFANVASPDVYLTGAEQKPHFESLGLGDKHHSLGLLLGPDGKKMASSSGEAFSADDLFAAVKAALKPTPEPDLLAWNIIACQMNLGNKAGNTKFVPQQWAKPEAPGMYVTYTYAKVMNALKKAGVDTKDTKGDAPVTPQDVELIGWWSYYVHYFNKAAAELEPHHLAQYAVALAKVLSKHYNTTTIVGGAPSFLNAMKYAVAALGAAMKMLGMYPLEEV